MQVNAVTRAMRLMRRSALLIGLPILVSSCALLDGADRLRRGKLAQVCELDQDLWWYECQYGCVRPQDTCTLQYRKKDSDDPWEDHEGYRWGRDSEEYRCVCK
jgi:hypothetical protein